MVVDIHSKWIEAVCTPNAMSMIAIEELHEQLARCGLPKTIVTDNGTCTVSEKFEAFSRANDIYHLTSAPYDPASDGLEEKLVQIAKKGLRKNHMGNLCCHLAKTVSLLPYSSEYVSITFRPAAKEMTQI